MVRRLYEVDLKSTTDIARELGSNYSAVRKAMLDGGLKRRTMAEGMRAARLKLGSGFRGKKRVFTLEHKDNIRAGRIAWAKENAKGVSRKKSGYIEITCG